VLNIGCRCLATVETQATATRHNCDEFIDSGVPRGACLIATTDQAVPTAALSGGEEISSASLAPVLTDALAFALGRCGILRAPVRMVSVGVSHAVFARLLATTLANSLKIGRITLALAFPDVLGIGGPPRRVGGEVTCTIGGVELTLPGASTVGVGGAPGVGGSPELLGISSVVLAVVVAADLTSPLRIRGWHRLTVGPAPRIHNQDREAWLT
jgi:hypothetical protein